MDKNSIKLELMQQLMLIESEELLNEVQKLIDSHTATFQLSEKHQQILDERQARLEKGESKLYSWDEVMKNIKKGE